MMAVVNTEPKKSVAILQSNYIPWKGYFGIIDKADVFVIYDEVQYTKNDWRNRNKIKGKSGAFWLTVPVSVKSSNQLIEDTYVSDKRWFTKHWKSIKSTYGRAAYFKDYEKQFEELYTRMESERLSDINLQLIKEVCGILNIDTEIVNSRGLNLSGDKNERLIDACVKLEANHYISGPAAKDYLQEDMFAQESIEVEWMDYSQFEAYDQLSTPFEHGVSVLDVIFNMGPRAQELVKANSL